MRNYTSTSLERNIHAFLNYHTVIWTEWQHRDYRRRKEGKYFDLLLPGNLQVQRFKDEKTGHILATSHYTLLERTLFTSIYTSPIIISFSCAKYWPLTTQILNLFRSLSAQEKNNSPSRTCCFKPMYLFSHVINSTRNTARGFGFS